MLNEDFCISLEAKINKAFINFKNEETRGFWCDGIMLPTFENELSPKNINDKRQLSTSAYIGKTGQDKYDLLIKFGPKSLSRYARGLDVATCISDSIQPGWYEIDVAQKQLTVYLS